jgi:UDP-N-acetyl-D-galactosamine dehydrogenase
MNELALIFNKMGIPTLDVLEAAGTKWNFLPFRPGLVGGHCIGVDPYYLTHKAEEIGYHPHVILAGREINDDMGRYIAQMTVKKLIEAHKQVRDARILVLGLTFKENVPDIRNTRVMDIISELKDFGLEAVVHDPCADAGEAREEYGIELVRLEDVGKVDGVVLAVAHRQFEALHPRKLKELCANGNGRGVVVDVKGILDGTQVAQAGLTYWAL